MFAHRLLDVGREPATCTGQLKRLTRTQRTSLDARCVLFIISLLLILRLLIFGDGEACNESSASGPDRDGQRNVADREPNAHLGYLLLTDAYPDPRRIARACLSLVLTGLKYRGRRVAEKASICLSPAMAEKSGLRGTHRVHARMFLIGNSVEALVTQIYCKTRRLSIEICQGHQPGKNVRPEQHRIDTNHASL